MDPQKIINFVFNEGEPKKTKGHHPLIVIVAAYVGLCFAAGLCRLLLSLGEVLR